MMFHNGTLTSHTENLNMLIQLIILSLNYHYMVLNRMVDKVCVNNLTLVEVFWINWLSENKIETVEQEV